MSLLTVFDLKPILSDQESPPLFSFGYHFHGVSFSLTLLLSLCVSLKYISYRLYIVEFCFFIHLATLYLLIRGFNAFTSELITDREEFNIVILFIVFCLTDFLSFPLLWSSFVFHWFFFVLTCFDLFLIFICLCYIAIFFVVAMGFTSNIILL